jgi:hypothetical protein
MGSFDALVWWLFETELGLLVGPAAAMLALGLAAVSGRWKLVAAGVVAILTGALVCYVVGWSWKAEVIGPLWLEMMRPVAVVMLLSGLGSPLLVALPRRRWPVAAFVLFLCFWSAGLEALFVVASASV